MGKRKSKNDNGVEDNLNYIKFRKRRLYSFSQVKSDISSCQELLDNKELSVEDKGDNDEFLENSLSSAKVRKRKLYSLGQDDNDASSYENLDAIEENLDDHYIKGNETLNQVDESLMVSSENTMSNSTDDQLDNQEKVLDIESEQDDSFSLGILVLILIGCLLLGITLGYVLYRLALNSSAVIKIISLFIKISMSLTCLY